MEEVYSIAFHLALEDDPTLGAARLGAEHAALERVIAAGQDLLGQLEIAGHKALGRPVAEATRQSSTAPSAETEAPDPTRLDRGKTIAPHVPVSAEVRPSPVIVAGRGWTRQQQPRQHALSAIVPPPPRPDPGQLNARPLPDRPIAPGGAGGTTLVQSSPGRELPTSLPNWTKSQAFAPQDAPPLSQAMASTVEAGWAPEMLSPVRRNRDDGIGPVLQPEGDNRATARLRPSIPSGTLPVIGEFEPRQQSREDSVATGGETQGRAMAQGDIYLDGARMGRWIADRLARDAERPQRGGTGFDGRMSPSWGGTL